VAWSNGIDKHLTPATPGELSDIRKRLGEIQRSQAQLNRSKELEYRSDQVKWVRQGSLIDVRAQAEAEIQASPPLIEWAITPTRWPL
jgi:hypothetical protein